MPHMSRFLTPKTMTFSGEKIPAFLIALYASFVLLIVRSIAIPLPFTLKDTRKPTILMVG